MLRLEPRGYSQVREWLAVLGLEPPPFLPTTATELARDHPVLHVAYREVADEVLGRILGFSGIANADAPLGLGSVEEVRWWPASDARSRVLVFPLVGFAEHLQVCVRGREEDLRKANADGTQDDERSFVTAAANVVGYCQAHDCALAIRW